MADIIFGSGISIGTGIRVTPPPFTIPDAPTIGTATTTGLTTATVAFTQPGNDGGLPITSYTATSSPGGITGTLSQAGSGTINMTGLSQGTSYTFTVTATNSIGTSSPSSASNSITTFAVPVNTVAPVVSGTATVGQTLSSTTGTWTGTATITYTYQWQRNNVNIASATSSTYTLVNADAGNPIRCVVTGTNSYGNSSANSNATSNVSAIVPGAPTIGTATAIGSTTATVTFTAPVSDGGSTITSYTATSSPGSITGTLSQAGSGTITVNGLTPSTSYTFTVTATNSIGTGSASSASNSTTTTAPQDSYFEYNTLLIPGASTTFVDDASTNNFAVSIFGDTKPNNFNPYTPGYYSNYFNGSSYLSVANNANLNLSNSSFTIELWVYGTGTYPQGLISKGNSSSLTSEAWSIEYTSSSGGIAFGTGAYNGWNAPMLSGTINLNAWNHVAVVRNVNAHTMYINGVSVSTLSASYTVTNAGTLYVGTGWYAPGSRIFSAGYISNVRLVIGTAVYTGNFTPSTTPLTAIANTSLLTCQSNRFIDNSTNAYTITTTGSPTINSFDPFVPNSNYSTYGSGYFDGTTDFVKTPSDASLSSTLLASNFTIECWVYVTSLPNAPTIWTNSVSNSDGFSGSYIQTNGTIGTGKYGVNEFNTTNTVKLNTWTHFALVRNSGTLYVYLNGVQDPTTGAASTYLNTSATKPMQIGSSNQSPPAAIQGFISDFRVVASAVYTSAFTPPATPLTAIANTSLLTLQNNQSVNNNVFLDNSTNNSFITRAGNATQGTFSPYGANWSNYFTNNILSCGNASLIAGTNTFTIEFWVYLNSINSGGGNNQTFIDTRSSNGVDSTAWLVGVINSTNLKWFTGTSDTNLGGTLPYRQWVHVAYTRNASNVITAYINGVATGTTTTDSRNLTNTNFWIGGNVSNTYPLDGYFSNVRWVVGTVVYTGNFTPSTTPLTAISNTKLLTCQSNRFIDNSGYNISISLTGSPTIQRFSPFNPSAEYITSTIGGSAYFDGTTSNITTTNTVTTIGTQDFCMEAWVYCFSTTNYACIIGNDTAGPSIAAFIEMGTTRGIFLGGPEVSLGSAQYNRWVHIVYCRVSGTYAGFVNGVRQATGSLSNNYTTAIKIGINNYAGTGTSGYGTTGYISDGRVTVGSSPYSPSSTTITVPTAPLTAVQNTVFLANMTSGGAYDAAMMNNLQTVGDAKLSTAVSKFGGSSMAFDGTGDYIQAISSPQFDFGLGDFTLECWAYCNNFSSDYRFIAKVANISSYGSWQVIVDNSGYPRFYASSAATSWDVCSNLGGGVAISTSTWAHIAVTRLGTTFTIWVNGVSAGTTTSSASLYYSASVPVTVGGMPDGTRSLNGYIDDVRITKGVARYTTTFTPPTTAFPTY